MATPALPHIGIDLDGVLIDHREHKLQLAAELGYPLEPWQTNANLTARFLPEEVYEALQDRLYAALTVKAPPVAGAMEELRRMRAHIYIVSARRASVLRFAQDWLAKHRVYDIVPAERIYFCGSNAEKKEQCRKHGIRAFFDDELAVTETLPRGTRRILLDLEGVGQLLEGGKSTQVLSDWRAFREIVEGLKGER